MKQFIALFFIALFSLPAFCNENIDVQPLVLEAEKQWNAGNPDKSFLTAGNSIEYGLGYLKKGKFTESLWYFEEVIKKDATNAYAQLFAGLAHIGLKDLPAAEARLTNLAGVSAGLQQGAKELLTRAKEEAAKRTAARKIEAAKAPAKQADTESPKPVTTKTETEPAAADDKKGGNLVYGDYVFTLDYWDVSQRRMIHQQKGYFTLQANGTYRYMNNTGRYGYNAKTGALTWQSGPFRNMGKNTTTFQRNKSTCQIDFEYHTSGGMVYYSGGKNL